MNLTLHCKIVDNVASTKDCQSVNFGDKIYMNKQRQLTLL